MKNTGVFVFILFVSLASCSVSRNYIPGKKFSADELKKDYSLMREILEKKHPNLYWYTPQSEMDSLFDRGYRTISDSMTENGFEWKIIAPLLSQIRCGHTSVMMSRGEQRFMGDKIIPSFPLFMKVWKDTMMVVANMYRDSIVKPGDFVLSINGIATQKIIDTLFQYISTDGFNNNLKYIRLSTSFPYYFRNVFGVLREFTLSVTDSNGVHKDVAMKWWPQPPADSLIVRPPKRNAPGRKERLTQIRSYYSDSSLAVIDLNAFTRGKLNNFFRKSFRKIRRDNIKNLIIDLRINGGGDMNKSVRLIRYIRSSPFRVADTVFSTSKNFVPYSSHISESFINNPALIFLSKKRTAGHYAFGYWERHVFQPKKKNHFNGHVYILTNGLTFSAASLFCALVKGEDNITLVGEETGGGWYGNAGVIIPNIVLPNTGLRIRLPFFRLVQSRFQLSEKGLGVEPDWYIGPDWRDILQNRDTKMEAVVRRILNEKQAPAHAIVH